jgi:hypothetical protein
MSFYISRITLKVFSLVLPLKDRLFLPSNFVDKMWTTVMGVNTMKEE